MMRNTKLTEMNVWPAAGRRVHLNSTMMRNTKLMEMNRMSDLLPGDMSTSIAQWWETLTKLTEKHVWPAAGRRVHLNSTMMRNTKLMEMNRMSDMLPGDVSTSIAQWWETLSWRRWMSDLLPGDVSTSIAQWWETLNWWRWIECLTCCRATCPPQ